MSHLIWTLWARWFVPPILLLMGAVAIRRVRRDWRNMGPFDRFIFTFNAIAMPPLGLFALVVTIWSVT